MDWSQVKACENLSEYYNKICLTKFLCIVMPFFKNKDIQILWITEINIKAISDYLKQQKKRFQKTSLFHFNSQI